MSRPGILGSARARRRAWCGRWLPWAGWLLSLAAVSGCAASGIGGRGRGVESLRRRGLEEQALVAYARGRYAELRGEEALALAQYAQVVRLDPRCDAAWARIGVLRCAPDPAAARDAFARALALAPESSLTWSAQAVCALGSGDVALGLRASLRAVELEPTRLEATLLHVDALAASGDLATAQAWLVAWVLRSPAHPSAWLRLAEIAGRQGRRELVEWAENGALQAGGRLPRAEREALARIAVDRQLIRRQLAAASVSAVEGRMSTTELALRALALGRPDLGAELGSLAFAADPSDTDAWIGLLAATSLGADREALEVAARALAADACPPGPLGAALLAQLLAREVGPDAAEAWLAAVGMSSLETPAPSASPGDE